MTGRVLRYPVRTKVSAVLATIPMSGLMALKLHTLDATALVLAISALNLCYLALLAAVLGKSTKMDECGISVRWFGLAYRSYGWGEIADVTDVWKPGRTALRYTFLQFTDGGGVTLPVPVPARTSRDARFDEEVGAIADARRAAAAQDGPLGADGMVVVRPPVSKALVRVLAAAKLVFRRSNARVGVAGLAWLLLIGCLVGGGASLHTVFRDRPVVTAYQAAKLCAYEQYESMAGPAEQWCTLQNMEVGDPIYPDGGQAGGASATGFFMEPDLPQVTGESSLQQLQDLTALGAPDSLGFAAFLPAGSPLLTQLGTGEDVSITVEAPLPTGSLTTLAASIEYQGVTTQTEDSPEVQVASDVDSTGAFVGFALFCGFLVFTAMRGWGLRWWRRRGWQAGLVALLALAIAQVVGTSNQQSSEPTASATPALVTSCLVGLAGFVVYLAVARAAGPLLRRVRASGWAVRG